MSVLERLGARWNTFWFAPASPFPLAAFRILLGGYLVVYFGLHAPHATTLFSREGVYVPYLVPDYAPGPGLALALFGLLWLTSLALLLGVACSWTIPVLLALYLHHYFLALAVKHSSFERLIVIYLLVLAPSRCDAVWSLSAAWRRWPPSAAATVAFAGRLMRFQTVLLYVGASLWKLVNPAWSSGALLYCTLQGIWATPLSFAIVRAVPSEAAWNVATWAVMGGEMLLGVLLAFRVTRPLGLVLGVLFHLSNTLILAIPEFLVCLAPYPLFLPERSLERFDSWLRLLFRRWRGAQET